MSQDKTQEKTKKPLTDEQKRKRIEDTVYSKVKNYFGKPVLVFGVIAFEDEDKKPVIALARGELEYIPEALGITFAQMFPRDGGDSDEWLRVVMQEIMWQVAVQRGDVVIGEDGNYYIPLSQDAPEDEEELPDDMRKALEVLTVGQDEQQEPGLLDEGRE